MGFLDKFRKKPRVTPGGSPIYRYETPEEQGWRPPESVGAYAEEITEHFEALFPGRESFVFHELISDLVHIDINIMRPTEKQDFYVLYTTGMSDLPMTLPDELSDREDLKYAELYLFLPGSWDLGKEFSLSSDMPESSYWPVRMLKFLVRFPHEYETWLGWGHTVPNGPEYTPLCDGVGFGGVVLSWTGEDNRLGGLNAEDGRKINFYSVIPAYKEEIEYKLKYGMEGLDKVFCEKQLPMILDIHRPNLCPDFKEVLDQ